MIEDIFALTLLLAVVLIAIGIGLRVTVLALDWTHPLILFVVPFVAYSVALPFSRLVLGSKISSYDTGFLACQVTALCCLGISYFIYAPHKGATPPPVESLSADISFVVIDVLMGITLGIHLYVTHQGGGLWASITMPYGFTADNLDFSEGQLTTFLGLTALSSILLLAYSYFSQMGRIRRWLYGGVIAFLALTQVLAGGRNAAMWVVLPILVLWAKRGHRVPLRWLIIGGVVAFVVLQAIGMVRNYGFGRAAQAAPLLSSDAKQVFDPMSGELGTSFNVFQLWRQADPQVTAAFGGRTLLVDPVITLAPRLLWPDRPSTIAQQFSFDYYGSNEFGLGFSGVVEAVLNFGWLGLFVVFHLIGMSLAWLARKWMRLGSEGPFAVLYALTFPAFLNFNRIDMATTVKLYLMRVVVAVAVYFVARWVARETSSLKFAVSS